MVMSGYGEGLSRELQADWFRDLVVCGSGHDCLFGVHPLIQLLFVGLLFS